MDLISIALAVKKALNTLFKSGQIGRTEAGKKLFTIELTDGQYMDTTRKSGSLEVGKTYTVTVDGETYTCKGKDGSEVDVDVFLGNLGLTGGTDTGEPFFIMEAFDNGTDNLWVLGALTNNGASTISVSTTETIHPIDPKFIPAFDSITLNGADGKQYKLSVDESGTLVHTAIEGA